MRYFFHIDGEGQFFEDSEGTGLKGPDEALLHAATIAGELAEEDEYTGCLVVVVDHNGAEIGSVPVPNHALPTLH